MNAQMAINGQTHMWWSDHEQISIETQTETTLISVIDFFFCIVIVIIIHEIEMFK